MTNAELECLPLGIGQNNEQNSDGTCLQVRLGDYWLLLDCGLSSTNLANILASEQSKLWSALLCTHAHNDHGRGLQGLHLARPDLPMFASEVTAKLLPLNWTDSDRSEFCRPLAWRVKTEIQPNLYVTLLPSGHLPGAASLWIDYAAADRDYTILYTGDFFLSNSRMVEGLRLDEFHGLCPDVLIIEGSYGTAHHAHRRSQENQLASQIRNAIIKGKSILLPVSKLGMGQEILMLLRSHHLFTGQDIDIWVDRAVAEVCDLYLELLPHLPQSIQNFAQHQSLFWDERVKPRVHRLSDRPEVSQVHPSVYLVDRDSDWSSWLHNHPTTDWLVLLAEPIDRNFTPTDRVELATYLLSDRSDVAGTTQLIHNLKPQHVVFIHGNSNYLSDLANLDELSSRYHVHCARVGMRLELPVNESLHLILPTRADRILPYEGELAELESEIILTLPPEIIDDPRWLNFAETGLIEARWQGEELIVRGITQRELLSTEPINPSEHQSIACSNCLYYRSFRCTNPESPLYDLKVSSDASCQAFKLSG